MKFSWKRSTAPTPAATTASQSETRSDNREMGYECKVYSLSDTGPTRTSNEDAVCAAYPDGSYQCLFAMVADGMGGHNAGEVASSMACDAMKSWVQQHYDAIDSSAMLNEGLQQAHQMIREDAARHAERKGMGTTAAALFIRKGIASFVHVGDSRIYWASRGAWTQLTTDHTLVNQLVASGELEAGAAAGHPMKNVITQAVGYTATIVPQTVPGGIAVSGGDRFLLLSDGVYDVMSGEELGMLVQLERPELVLESIRSLCTTRKSSDNFSVILITLSDDLLPLPSITKEQNALS